MHCLLLLGFPLSLTSASILASCWPFWEQWWRKRCSMKHGTLKNITVGVNKDFKIPLEKTALAAGRIHWAFCICILSLPHLHRQQRTQGREGRTCKSGYCGRWVRHPARRDSNSQEALAYKIVVWQTRIVKRLSLSSAKPQRRSPCFTLGGGIYLFWKCSASFREKTQTRNV